MTGIRYE